MPLEKQTAKDKLKQVLRGLFQLAGVSDPDTAADSAVQSLDGTPAAYPDIRLHALKGGTYKIKEYYMENDALQDIRGASALISEVQDHLLPEFLRKKTGFDPILYNGGGNILALVPEETDARIAVEMEQLADRYLITANSAYVLSEPFMLSEFLGSQYHELQSKLEYDLNERKKTKVSFAAAPESEFIGETFLHPSLKLFAAKLPGEPEEYCVKCQKRLARYKRNGKTICGGCLHKVHVGENQRSRYLEEYNKKTGMNASPNKTLEEIDEDHIAVLYADGNNMGGIIQNLPNIADMIDFSDFVKDAMKRIVFSALKKQKVSKLEIVAVGGDDVFLILPANQAFKFSIDLIKKYKEEFDAKFPHANSTLSVGFCVMKTSTPIKVALEVAEEEMKKAKRLVLLDSGEGSLSFRVFKTYEGAVTKSGEETLLPYSIKAATQIDQFADSFSDNVRKTQLQNFSSAFHQADVPEEASLFLDYTNAKLKGDQKDQIILPPIDGYELDGGFYTRTGKYQTDRHKRDRGFLWDDLINILSIEK